MKFSSGYPLITNGFNKSLIQCGWAGGWGNYSEMFGSWDQTGSKAPGGIITSEGYPLIAYAGANGTPNQLMALSVRNDGLVTMPAVYTTIVGGEEQYTLMVAVTWDTYHLPGDTKKKSLTWKISIGSMV